MDFLDYKYNITLLEDGKFCFKIEKVAKTTEDYRWSERVLTIVILIFLIILNLK